MLLSCDDAASHRHWRNSLEVHLPEYKWHQVALSARNFAWRVRGSSLSLYIDHREDLEKDIDLLITTSMVDLSALRGMHPRLTRCPNVLYFHENQFVYPISREQTNILNAQLTSIYSAISADEIWFNSEYNLTSFVEGAEKLLRKIPDKIKLNVSALIANKSKILAVPIEPPGNNKIKGNSESIPHILWNHRWEYDKQPEVFFNALRILKANNVEFELSVVGESFRQVPESFIQAQSEFETQITNWGYQSKDDYLKLLSEANIVISSALHDFQGLSLLEAISYGCTPIAPNRLVYPEYIPDELLYKASGDSQLEAEELAKLVASTVKSKSYQAIDISRYFSSNLIPQYRQAIEKVI